MPLFSDFFLAILQEYGLLLAHLSPQAVATMAAFQHLCEAFMGMMPSVSLFRYFFVPRLSEVPVRSGRLSWALRPDALAEYPKGTCIECPSEWRDKWCHVEVHAVLPCFDRPEAPLAANATWMRRCEMNRHLFTVVRRIIFLKS